MIDQLVLRPRWAVQPARAWQSSAEVLETALRQLAGSSPAEELFLEALDLALRGQSDVSVRDGAVLYTHDGKTLRVESQRQVGPYFADITLSLELIGELAAAVVVEVDGHEFHEKTPDQAAHDNRRDRFFAAEGLMVLRFTAREVWHKGPNCVGEALQVLNRMAPRQAHIAGRMLWLKAKIARLARLIELSGSNQTRGDHD